MKRTLGRTTVGREGAQVDDDHAEAHPEHVEPEGEYLPELTNEAKNWGALCHAAALLGLFPLVGFGHIVGPLIVWLVKRNDHPYIDEQGKEAINFQLSVMIYSVFLICI